MLRTVSRNALTKLGGLRPASAALRFEGAAYSSNIFEEKGRGEENVRFRKEDERLLRQLLNKVKAHADTVDVHEAENTKSLELAALKKILGKYNVSDDDLNKVLAWKHT